MVLYLHPGLAFVLIAGFLRAPTTRPLLLEGDLKHGPLFCVWLVQNGVMVSF